MGAPSGPTANPSGAQMPQGGIARPLTNFDSPMRMPQNIPQRGMQPFMHSESMNGASTDNAIASKEYQKLMQQYQQSNGIQPQNVPQRNVQPQSVPQSGFQPFMHTESMAGTPIDNAIAQQQYQQLMQQYQQQLSQNKSNPQNNSNPLQNIPQRGMQPMQSQSMFTGAPTGGGGDLGQLAANVSQTGIQPMESQQMMTGAPTGGGGALGQLANPQAQQIQNPTNAQRVAKMLRNAGPMLGRF